MSSELQCRINWPQFVSFIDRRSTTRIVLTRFVTMRMIYRFLFDEKNLFVDWELFGYCFCFEFAVRSKLTKLNLTFRLSRKTKQIPRKVTNDERENQSRRTPLEKKRLTSIFLSSSTSDKNGDDDDNVVFIFFHFLIDYRFDSSFFSVKRLLTPTFVSDVFFPISSSIDRKMKNYHSINKIKLLFALKFSKEYS